MQFAQALERACKALVHKHKRGGGHSWQAVAVCYCSPGSSNLCRPSPSRLYTLLYFTTMVFSWGKSAQQPPMDAQTPAHRRLCSWMRLPNNACTWPTLWRNQNRSVVWRLRSVKRSHVAFSGVQTMPKERRAPQQPFHHHHPSHYNARTVPALKQEPGRARRWSFHVTLPADAGMAVPFT